MERWDSGTAEMDEIGGLNEHSWHGDIEINN